MKKHLFFLFVLLNFTINAQIYQPFPESGISWREDESGLGFGCCCSVGPQAYCLMSDKFEHFLQGDTTIGAHVYHKIYQLGYYDEYVLSQTPVSCPSGCQNYNPQFYSSYYVGGLRQDVPARKVYFHSPEAGAQDTLLYDFNLNVGDYLPESYNNHASTNWVHEIDSVLVGNVYHKRYWLNYMGVNQGYVAIIEGIGSTFGLLYNLVPPFEFQNQLVCVKINSNPVYPDTETICSLNDVNEIQQIFTYSLAPNPVNNVSELQVNAEFEGSDLIVYNETGQKISQYKIKNQTVEIRKNDFNSGIYFFRITNKNGQIGTGKFVIVD